MELLSSNQEVLRAEEWNRCTVVIKKNMGFHLDESFEITGEKLKHILTVSESNLWQ